MTDPNQGKEGAYPKKADGSWDYEAIAQLPAEQQVAFWKQRNDEQVTGFNKFKEDKEGLVKFLQEWVNYSSHSKAPYDEQYIRRKVEYHWSRDYKFTNKYLND